jgi:hypothetical protein
MAILWLFLMFDFRMSMIGLCENNGIVIHVVRDGVKEVGIPGHSSEAMDVEFDGTRTWRIINNTSIGDLYNEVDKVIKHFDIPLVHV